MWHRLYIYKILFVFNSYITTKANANIILFSQKICEWHLVHVLNDLQVVKKPTNYIMEC